jgi:hypothetical protein
MPRGYCFRPGDEGLSPGTPLPQATRTSRCYPVQEILLQTVQNTGESVLIPVS